jgi:hypothetical protein
MIRYARTTLIVLVLIAAGFIFINYYQYIFAKSVEGEIVGVERVTESTAILGGNNLTPQMLYSFAIAVREEKTGTIYTSSTEDRKWAVAKKGFCARVILYPYPPWELGKSGEYYGARLEELRDCNNLLGKNAAPEAAPMQAEPSPTATP